MVLLLSGVVVMFTHDCKVFHFLVMAFMLCFLGSWNTFWRCSHTPGRGAVGQAADAMLGITEGRADSLYTNAAWEH